MLTLEGAVLGQVGAQMPSLEGAVLGGNLGMPTLAHSTQSYSLGGSYDAVSGYVTAPTCYC